MSKLRIGIIGTGGIARKHIESYLQMEDIELVAGADIIEGKAREFLDKHGCTSANAYETADEMLAKENLDGVSICTYNSTHAECAIKALEADCHVLLEKPMTVYLEDAIEIMKAEKRTGKIVTIGFQPRYDSRMKKIKEIVQSGKLGDIYYIQTGGGRRRGIPGRTFIEKKTAGVGALADIGCYALDMALNSIGYPKPLTVSAVAYNHFGTNPKYNNPDDAKRFDVDDFSAAFIRLEGGITLDFRMSWAMHMDTTGATLFLGKDAGLKVEPANPELLWGGAWDGSCGNVTLFHDEFDTPTHTPVPLNTPVNEDRFYLKVRSFVDAIINGEEAPIPTRQIIYNQAIIDGIIRSAESGKEVDIIIPEI